MTQKISIPQHILEEVQISQAYVIREVGTKRYIPQVKGRSGRGGSHAEPVATDIHLPRLFTTERSAKAFISQWRRGKQTCIRWEDGTEDHDLIPVPHRETLQLEILPVSLIHPS